VIRLLEPVASLWKHYDVTPRLGPGVHHQSRNFASISIAVLLPAYARVDAALFFRLSEGIEAQLNPEDLLDEIYFPTAYSINNISTAPRPTRRAWGAGCRALRRRDGGRRDCRTVHGAAPVLSGNRGEASGRKGVRQV
jgi:hypothetical protein